MAVDGITFFIEKGRIFGLQGPDGADKTTTINVLAQILKPDSGKITNDGMDLLTHQICPHRPGQVQV
jgi:ABC-type multidrug transport system ATPase subunit